MLPIIPSFVVYPTRIANVVHYLTHGKTINPILINPDEFDRLQQWVQKTLSKKSQVVFYKEQAALIQKKTKQTWGAK